MKKLMLASAIAIFASTSHADYRASVNANYSEVDLETETLTSNSRGLSGIFYFAPVTVSGSTPVLEAPFLNRSSSVYAGYVQSKDTYRTTFQGDYLRDETTSNAKVIGGRAVMDRTIFGLQTLIHEHVDVYTAELGYYLSDSATLTASVGIVNSELGGGDSTPWGLEYRNLIALQAINSVAITTSISGTGSYRSLDLSGMFYLTPRAGVGLGYSREGRPFSSDANDEVSVNGTYFFTEGLGLDLGFSRVANNGFVEDYNIINLGLRVNL